MFRRGALFGVGLLGLVGGYGLAQQLGEEMKRRRKRELVLYGSNMSPYSRAVELFMAYEGIAHARIEVDPWKKQTLLSKHPSAKRLPCLAIHNAKDDDVLLVEKAQEIIEWLQSEHLARKGALPEFSLRQKNVCMKFNERVLPLVAVNRHATLAKSRETVAFMENNKDALAKEWGRWTLFANANLVPFMYWRIWHKMTPAVLRDYLDKYGGEEKKIIFTTEEREQRRELGLVALCRTLEALQVEERSGGAQPFFGGSSLAIPDLWLYAHLCLFEHESLFPLVASACPLTLQWYNNVKQKISS